jgi:hypothetical protein
MSLHLKWFMVLAQKPLVLVSAIFCKFEHNRRLLHIRSSDEIVQAQQFTGGEITDLHSFL